MEDGDLLLIDAGCEYGYHASDITRTFPVNGRFTGPQRAVYEVVLQAQLAAIAAARPGVPYEVIHEAARRVIAEGLVELKLLPRSVADSLAMHHYREFFMHGTGHWLGMDVHDVGDYRVQRQSRALEPGMVFTVEPGIYIDPERESVTFHLREYSEDEMWERRLRLGMAAAKKLEDEEKAKAATVTHPIPAEFRGIGMRIEDDILVTAGRGRKPDRRHPQDRRGGRAHLRRGPAPAALTAGPGRGLPAAAKSRKIVVTRPEDPRRGSAMREAVVVASSRTPLAKSFRGSFNLTRPDDLAAHCITRRAAARRPSSTPRRSRTSSSAAASRTARRATTSPGWRPSGPGCR